MSKELHEMCKCVVDETTFLEFVHALVEAREQAVQLEKAHPSSPFGPDAGGSENITIESYLEASARWAEDSQFGRRIKELGIKV